MWNNLKKWCENLWKIREIFDKYLPMIKSHHDALMDTVATIRKLRMELEIIKAEQKKQQEQLDTNFSILTDLGGVEDTQK